ncbi:hypothetical protein [Caballeronia sp. LZ043]|uniref:hypothetical protein n=1 Tax=Caballeronia sp. LZ043 TaxID=3038569 RepID=UPI00285F5BE2|nr:hypothetical protein [Caballeronia sp. LZ043]MDR5819296.1 hypothetical protein [Caballeronia sp. LZ043]
MASSREIKHLEYLRYRLRLCHNEGPSQSWRLVGALEDSSMSITYNEVIAARKRDLVTPAEVAVSTATQILRNHLSTLHSYLAFSGKTEDANVGREFLTGFDEGLQSYLDSLDVKARTKSDRRSHLRAWHSVVCSLRSPSVRMPVGSPTVENQSPFHKLLRHTIASTGLAAKTLARRAGASTSAIQRWLKGGYPDRRTFASVHRIEVELGLERDALLALIPPKTSPNAQSSHQSIPFRERHRLNTKKKYRLSYADMSEEFLREWFDFFDYKTSKSPQLERSDEGSWRVLPFDKIGRNLSPHARRANRGCPTADIALNRLRSFIGFLTLPIECGGFGVPADAAQSLAWLAVPSAIEGYLEFMSDRSDGTVHAGHAGFCALGASLTNAKTGYLVQQPSFASRVPAHYARRSWADACSEAYQLYRRWARDAKEQSRKPYEPIQGLLNLSEPLAPLFRAVEALDELAAQAAPASIQESVYKRDALLLSVLLANPLRARNCMLMTWRENGTGSLYQREDGQWRLRFGARDFKNDRHAAQTDYDAPLPRSMNHRIEEYLCEHRPRLLKSNPSGAWVFPGKTGKKWQNLNKQVARRTRKLIPETPGFAPHAIRHLVATDWLRKHPGDYLTAAELLHDKLRTVLENYSHLRQDDSFNRYEEHLNAVGAAMKK